METTLVVFFEQIILCMPGYFWDGQNLDICGQNLAIFAVWIFLIFGMEVVLMVFFNSNHSQLNGLFMLPWIEQHIEIAVVKRGDIWIAIDRWADSKFRQSNVWFELPLIVELIQISMDWKADLNFCWSKSWYKLPLIKGLIQFDTDRSPDFIYCDRRAGLNHCQSLAWFHCPLIAGPFLSTPDVYNSQKVQLCRKLSNPPNRRRASTPY